ncbi:MAG: bifunctional riboflavin kinase/FAD synthetase [Eubacteriales bacterium]|nr:bifunctional riboflavin kinase/FAD synthetase [Eubacteriales bacterium]
MKYIEGLMDYTMDRDTAVTLGKFDGLHRGHQQLIKRICAQKTRGLESVVVTVWPDPSAKALLTKGEKKERLRKMGVQWWMDCPFLPQISHMEPEEFIREILVKRLRTKYVAVGRDFRFGYQRKGSWELLEAMKEELGYELEVVEKEKYEGREISSTYVKTALSEGNMELVRELLGYPYTVQGEVLHGRHIGRTLGMPTTNLIPSVGKLLPPNGVYATVTHLDGKEIYGITNIGYKPTIGEYFRGVETYLFDFDGDLYGKNIMVELHTFERPEQKFDGMEALKNQMHRDIDFGKKYFGCK